MVMTTVPHRLTEAEFERVGRLGTVRSYQPGELIISEGEAADQIFFIERGRVSIFIQRFASREEINVCGPGEYFGEIAFLNSDRRTASVAAAEEATLVCLDRAAFAALAEADRTIADKVGGVVAERNRNLILKEKLQACTGVRSRNLHISIKGDPSLRETAFRRERHDSQVDGMLPQLATRMEDLLINRCVYQLFVHLNSGEMRALSVLAPFNEEVHPAARVVEDPVYVERHFPAMSYGDKTAMMTRLIAAIAGDPVFADLPEPVRQVYAALHDDWQPITPEEIVGVINRVPLLRSIPDFYLRNLSISIARDAIRMQFNCDGTHIVDAGALDAMVAKWGLE